MKLKTTLKKPQPQFVRRGYKNSSIKRKKLGFDIHGVLDTKSSVFRMLLQDLIRQGWEIHILTGGTWKNEQHTLKRLGIPFTHFFSIVDHHVAVGSKVKWDKSGNAHLDPSLWDRTKALYCKTHGITIHFDDSDIYGFYFQTPYVRYFSKDTPATRKLHNL